MSRPKRVSDEAIFAAIRREARTRGAEVSLARVAAHVGLSEPALFKRFGSRKQMMIRALGTELRATWVEALREGPDGRSLDAQLASILARVGAFFGEIMPYLTALRASGIPVRDVAVALDRHPSLETLGAVESWLERAARAGLVRSVPFEATSLALVGSMQVLTFLTHVLDRPPFEMATDDYVRDLAAFFARALAPTPSAARRAPPRKATPGRARGASRRTRRARA